MTDSPRLYGTQAKDRAPLVDFMCDALKNEGCRIIHASSPDQAPFRITFETPQGEHMGIVAYAFLATFTPTRNRPKDEHSFQLKYGSRDGDLHELWQDPYGVYTTLLIGINPEQGFFVAADPILHSPTKFYIRIEFKQEHVDEILNRGWYCWERVRRDKSQPLSVMVGGTASSFLKLVRFERDALREDQGHRQLLAEKAGARSAILDPGPLVVPSSRVHELAAELALDEREVLDLIANAKRLKMAVRGWAAEEHLVRMLRNVEGVTECARIEKEGAPDVTLRYRDSRPISIECKNVARTTRRGLAHIDFMRTRTSADPCSRYYSTRDFDVVAACMHAFSERWEFRFALPTWLNGHKTCVNKLSNNVVIDERWNREVGEVLIDATRL